MSNNIIKWSGYEWLTRERWGSIHPKKSWNWYDPSCVVINDNNQLELHIKHNPKEFNIDNKKIMSNYGIGLVTCETPFSYGKFEIKAKLPKGIGLWPAFWTYDNETWPPEIDIFEAYSKKNNYKSGNFLKPYNIESCFHSHKELNLKKIPPRKPWICDFNNDPTENFNTYGLLWTKNNIILYINHKIVRKIKNKEIINYLNKYPLMRVILNTHISGRYLDDFTFDSKNPFIIDYFIYNDYIKTIDDINVDETSFNFEKL